MCKLLWRKGGLTLESELGLAPRRRFLPLPRLQLASGGRLLVIDCEPAIGELIHSLLAAEGVDVAVVLRWQKRVPPEGRVTTWCCSTNTRMTRAGWFLAFAGGRALS